MCYIWLVFGHWLKFCRPPLYILTKFQICSLLMIIIFVPTQNNVALSYSLCIMKFGSLPLPSPPTGMHVTDYYSLVIQFWYGHIDQKKLVKSQDKSQGWERIPQSEGVWVHWHSLLKSPENPWDFKILFQDPGKLHENSCFPLTPRNLLEFSVVMKLLTGSRWEIMFRKTNSFKLAKHVSDDQHPSSVANYTNEQLVGVTKSALS